MANYRSVFIAVLTLLALALLLNLQLLSEADSCPVLQSNQQGHFDENVAWRLASAVKPHEIGSVVKRIRGSLAPLELPSSVTTSEYPFTHGHLSRANGQPVTLVHTTWKTTCIPLYHVFTRSVLQQDGETQLVFWSDAAIDHFVSQHFALTKFGAAFKRLQLLKHRHAGWYGASRADLFRLLVIWMWGGVYVDFDVNFERPAGTFFNAYPQFSGWEPHTVKHNAHLIYNWTAGQREKLTLAGVLGSAIPQGPMYTFYLNRIVDNLLRISNEEIAECNPVDCTSPRIQAKLWWEFHDANESARKDAHMYQFHEFVRGGIEHHGHCSWCSDVEKNEQSYDIRSMVPSRGLILPEGSVRQESLQPCKYIPGQAINWNPFEQPGSGPILSPIFPLVSFDSTDYSSMAKETAVPDCPYESAGCGQASGNISRSSFDQISSRMALAFQCAWLQCLAMGRFARAFKNSWACFPERNYDPAVAIERDIPVHVSHPNVTYAPSSMAYCAESHPPQTMFDLSCPSGSRNPSSVLVPMLFGSHYTPGIIIDMSARSWQNFDSVAACFVKYFGWDGIFFEPTTVHQETLCESFRTQIAAEKVIAVRGAAAPSTWTHAWTNEGLKQVPFSHHGLINSSWNLPLYSMGFPIDFVVARLGVRAVDILVVRAHGFELDALLGLNLTQTIVRVILLSNEAKPQSFAARAYIVAHGYEAVGSFEGFFIWVLPSQVSDVKGMWNFEMTWSHRLSKGNQYGPMEEEPRDYLREALCKPG